LTFRQGWRKCRGFEARRVVLVVVAVLVEVVVRGSFAEEELGWGWYGDLVRNTREEGFSLTNTT